MSSEMSPIELIKTTVKLSSFASLHKKSDLKSIGDGKYRTSCFVHGGDNPNSMLIDDNNNMWHCFACGEGGSIFDMWMGVNPGKEFSDSLEAIAGQYGVKLPEDQSHVSKRRIIDLQNSITEECVAYLLTSKNDDARAARRYLKSRGIGKRIVNEWEIGLMPEGDDAVDLLKDMSKDTQAMEHVNLLRGGSRGEWSPFAGRLMFPIMDERRNVMGFSGRVIPGVDSFNQSSKYYNSPENAAYRKSQVLYGMQNLPADRKEKIKKIIVTEGQLDTIAVNMVTDDDTVALAACGTALGTSHLPIIERARNLSFLFDGDKAGQRAVIRSFWVLNHIQDTVITAAVMDGDDDPFDLYANDPDALTRIINQGLPFISVAVKAQWNLLEKSRSDMNEWVKVTASNLTFTAHREMLISDGAIMMGQNLTAYKKNLSLPSRLVDDKRYEKSSQRLSQQTEALISMLLAIPYDEMQAVLSPLSRWTDNCSRAVENWMPTSNPMDIEAIRRLAVGIDSEISHETEIAIASLQPKTDDAQVNVRIVLSGMIRQMLARIGEMAYSGPIGFLETHMMNLRKALRLIDKIGVQPSILAYLVDCAVDIEIVSARHERKMEMAS